MPPSPSVSAAQAEAAETLASMMESTKNRGEEEAEGAEGPRRNESTTSPPQASHATTSSAAATTGLVGENEQHLPAPPLQADETRTHLRPPGPGYHDDDGPVVPRMHPPRTAGYLSARRDVGMSPEGGGGGGGGDILSRMVTIAAPGAGLRVASMEDFRRSVHRGGSPDGMRGGGEAGADPTTALNNNTPAGGVSDIDRASSSSDNSGRDATAASPPGGPSLSNRGNPLLRMMEERMAARQRQSQSQARTAQTSQVHGGTPPSPALQASIDKWAAIDRSDGDVSRNDRGGVVEGAPGSGGSGRAPLSSTQERLLMELIGSQASSSSGSTAQHRAAGLPGQASYQPTSSSSAVQPRQRSVTAQHLATAGLAYQPSQACHPSRMSSSTMAPQPLGGLMPPMGAVANSPAQDPLASARLGLDRCAMSAAALSAVGHAAQRRHFVGQVRAAQQRRFQQQFALRRNGSMPTVAAGPSRGALDAPPGHRGDQLGRPDPTNILANARRADLPPSSMRKRRSGSFLVANDGAASNENSRSSLTTDTSASSGSNKMRRTIYSHGAGLNRSCLYGSMNSLRLHGGSDGSFGNIAARSAYDLGGSARRGNDMLLRRNASSSRFVRGVVGSQSSAGLAAAAFEALHGACRRNSTFVLPGGPAPGPDGVAGGATSPSRPAEMTAEQVARLRGLQQQQRQAQLHQMIQLQSLQQHHEQQQEQVGRVACSVDGSAVQASSADGSDGDGSDGGPNSESGGEGRDVLSALPVQVDAEDYSAPSTARSAVPSSGASVSSVNSCVDKIIVSDVPDRIKYKDAPVEVRPMDVVVSALRSRGDSSEVLPSGDMEPGYFVEVTEMYVQDAVDAIRGNDVACLRRLREDGRVLDCGNGFGETLMHMACRRSDVGVISMLLTEGRASLRVRDDFGRTPFHDACWRTEPDLDILDLLLDNAPELLMLSDKRGHTPLDYSRRQHWGMLVSFLEGRKGKFRPALGGVRDKRGRGDGAAAHEGNEGRSDISLGNRHTSTKE